MVDFLLCLGRRGKRTISIEHAADSTMLVSEAGVPFQQQTVITVCVSTFDGLHWDVDVDPDMPVEKVKLMAVGHFYDPAETAKVASQYKLVLVSEGKQLSDELSLLQEGVKDNDDIILLNRRRGCQATVSAADERDAKGPDQETIDRFTSHIKPANQERIAEDPVTVVDFQTELRKVLVTLIGYAQRIQLFNDNRLPLFNSQHGIRMGKPKNGGASVVSELPSMPCYRNEAVVDPVALKQLTEMGFSVSKATKALLSHKMSAIDALEHLLIASCDNQDDGQSRDNVNPGPPPIGNLMPLTKDLPDKQPSADAGNTSSAHLTFSSTASSASALIRIVPLPELMEVFRAFKRKEFRPSPKAFRNLKEMGFAEDKILDALRVSGNDQDAAFEWLIGRWPTAQDFTLELDVDGPIYKAVIANPVIQLGLSSPKILFAFLHMLENPSCANHWFNDPDAAPLLSQIFKIYHSEKYSLEIRPPFRSS